MCVAFAIHEHYFVADFKLIVILVDRFVHLDTFCGIFFEL